MEKSVGGRQAVGSGIGSRLFPATIPLPMTSDLRLAKTPTRAVDASFKLLLIGNSGTAAWRVLCMCWIRSLRIN